MIHTDTATASSAGTATVTFSHNKSGLRWIVWQISVQTVPVRSSAQFTLMRNGIYVSSSIVGSSSSAQGPPALDLQAHDVLTGNWVGMTAGDECILNLMYEETGWDQTGTAFGLV